jgi:hypothetical protein
MSMDPYQVNVMLRLERMTRAERLAADEQAGRMAYELWSLARAVRSRAGALRRWARHDGAAIEVTPLWPFGED